MNTLPLSERIQDLQGRIDVLKFWSRQAREAAAEARRQRGQPKRRWLKAGALAAVGTPLLGAAYFARTRASRYK